MVGAIKPFLDAQGLLEQLLRFSVLSLHHQIATESFHIVRQLQGFPPEDALVHVQQISQRILYIFPLDT